VNIVDIPEPKQLKVKFQYNFFTTDERSNDSGQGVTSGQINPAEIPGLADRVPRFVKINWKPSFVSRCATNGNEFTSGRQNNGVTRRDNVDMFNEQNAEFIQDELTFSNFDFVTIDFQDNGLDDKLFNLVSGSTRIRGIEQTSLTQLAKDLNDYTVASVNGNTLVEAANNLQACGILFTTPDGQEQIERTTFDKLKELSVHTQINNKIVGTLARSVAEDSLNIYADEMQAVVSHAEQLQKDAIEKLESTSVNSIEWDTGFVPLRQRRVDANASSFELSDVQVVGYLVEKEEIQPDGSVIKLNPFLIKEKTSSFVVDAEVKYGGVYRYQVRTITAVSLPAKNQDGDPIVASGLIASQPSASKTISCVESVPPPPPADFKVNWDYGERAARLLWSFPVNSQRDIKYFQIFRRKSMDEPFELIREFDFDDSEEPILRGETIDQNLIFKMTDPRTFFIDREFTKDSKCIYALCSIDAHGLSSNYSTQFEVSFDRFRNKMNAKMFSKAGAPKAFPNMYLRNDTFIDTIKTSNFDRLTVYFDPEYLRVTNKDAEDLRLLPLDDPFSKYLLQFINTDFQTSQNITFTIDDRRTNDNTSTSEGGRDRRTIKTSLDRRFSGFN
jgi:hypothetical protein